MAKCWCCDSGCPVHKGSHCDAEATIRLYRVDMEHDVYGTAFCDGCAEDALESGLYVTESELEDEA